PDMKSIEMSLHSCVKMHSGCQRPKG
ncbi:hypothetical protein A2U01_0047487, partial [Trifolium medium]|nr:hypothetical protein [Trifolium medium]